MGEFAILVTVTPAQAGAAQSRVADSAAQQTHEAETGAAAETHAGTQQPDSHEGGEHAVPTALGIGPTAWVSLAMIAFLLIAIFKGRLFDKIRGGLDGQIDTIREQLKEAKDLRKEAEALREEYQAKIAGAEKDAEAMLDRARNEADQIRAQAEADSKAMIARRKQMAEDKIAAAQRDAVTDVRAAAATAATAAAQSLIASKHDAKADKALTDTLIGEV